MEMLICLLCSNVEKMKIIKNKLSRIRNSLTADVNAKLKT